MTPLVIDASISVKWFIPETHSINALRLLKADCDLLAPDLIFAEFGNVLWKKWLRNELESEVISPLLADLIRMRLRIVPTVALAEMAADIAITYRRSFYDSIYLALAVSTQGRMVTADEKLCNALRTTPLAERLLWIEDVVME
jgi:predicted nucleic acid-binding protein